MLIFLLTFLLAASLVFSSNITVNYPLEEQLPPVARTNSSYTWTFATDTFTTASNHTLTYTTSSLPAWLTFDPSQRIFHGTPLSVDEGSPEIEVTAHDSSSSETASSSFDLLVSSTPAPVLQHSIDEQFHLPNPSLSSVFVLSENSALRSTHPALRIPPGWSFSIGFDYDTFKSDGNIYYAATKADGSPLPDWMYFNPKQITFNGFTPKGNNNSEIAPYTISLALHGSDQEGYSALALMFDVVISQHEVSLSATSLPTINITAETPFSVSLASPVDFYGVLLDGKQIQPAQIVALEVDTSYYGQWLKYDTESRTLSGQPPDSLKDGDQSTLLPITLTTTVNQTIETNVSLAVVPSYFSTSQLQPILVNPGQPLDFNLAPFYSNATEANGQRDDVNLTAAFEPDDASGFLSFDPSSGFLTGTIPSGSDSNGVNYTHIGVTFTAYSRVTHSTSHATLPVSLSPSDFAHQHGPAHGLSAAAKAKLILGLKISSAIIGGMVSLGLFLACMRKCTRVKDTALEGEEGMRAWSAEERKYYGVGIEVNGKSLGEPPSPGTKEKGHDWSDTAIRGISPPLPLDDKYTALSARQQLHRDMSSVSHIQSPRMMRKGEFMGKIKVTARKVSDTVRFVGDSISKGTHVFGSLGTKTKRRPMISKPVLITSAAGAPSLTPRRVDPLQQFGILARNGSQRSSPRHPEQLPFEEIDFSHYAPSAMTGTSIAGSPSSSTGERSIPRRRPDFGRPPKSPLVLTTPPQAHLHDRNNRRRPSLDSTSSLDTNSSSNTHAAEAVVQHAHRALSVRSSTKSASNASVISSPQTHARTKEKMSIVNFTHANRVPVPKLPSGYFAGDDDANADQNVAGNERANTRRVASQVAKVFRSASTSLRADKSSEEDALSLGIEYVQVFGDDSRNPGDRTSASYSVETSSHGHGNTSSTKSTQRILARIREAFRFRVQLDSSTRSDIHSVALETKLASGERVPRFIRADLGSTSSKSSSRSIEFSGTPLLSNVGEYCIMVYVKGTEECVGRVVLEIVQPKRA
ncbi:hypothetical protein QCA50_013538 [Cerrena zonata]|uniref:Dystroglycan-type cadherin-like domain-containing protein n=1 Tax=Cerrena zonata TaxID=2478898 RepID=A0AAW0FQY8_9APHY